MKIRYLLLLNMAYFLCAGTLAALVSYGIPYSVENEASLAEVVTTMISLFFFGCGAIMGGLHVLKIVEKVVVIT